MREKINAQDYTSQIMQSVHKGILLTTKVGEQVNTMTIGLGNLIALDAKRTVFMAHIQQGRYSKELLEQAGEFTISIPLKEKHDKEILMHCGTTSGRERDKIADLGLTLVEPQKTDTPAILEFPLTLECKVIYADVQHNVQLEPSYKKMFYPAYLPGVSSGKNPVPHTVFYGEIVAAYILHDPSNKEVEPKKETKKPWKRF